MGEKTNEFYYENTGSATYLVYEIKAKEAVDTMVLGMLTNNQIPGLARAVYTQLDDRRFFKYNVSSRVTAKQVLSDTVDRKRLMAILNGLTDAFASTEDYMLDPGQILLDPQYIYVDVSGGNAEFICLPVTGREAGEVSFRDFVKNVMFTTQFDSSENTGYVAQIMNYLNAGQDITPAAFRQFLGRMDSAKSAGADYGAQTGSTARKPKYDAYTGKPIGASEYDSRTENYTGNQGQYFATQTMNGYGAGTNFGETAGGSGQIFGKQTEYGREGAFGAATEYGMGAAPGAETEYGMGAAPGAETEYGMGLASGARTGNGRAAAFGAQANANAAGARSGSLSGAGTGRTPAPGSAYAGMKIPGMNSTAGTGAQQADPAAAGGTAAGGEEEEITWLYLMQHYNKDRAAQYKAQKQRKKQQAAAQSGTAKNAKKDKKGNKKGKKNKNTAEVSYDIPGAGPAGGAQQNFGQNVQYGGSGQFGQGLQYGQDAQYGGSGQFSQGPQYGQDAQYGGSGQFAQGPQYGQDAQYGGSGQFGQGPQYGQNAQYGGSGQFGQGPQYGQDAQYGVSGQFSQGPQYGQDAQYGGSNANAQYYADDAGSGETMLLDDGYAETMLLNEEAESAGSRPVPFLVRLSNHQRIMIDKPIFKIGRDPNYVDYCISDNKYVGQSHANILTRGDQYFLIDNNTKNHTYINGNMLGSNDETLLKHEDKVRFANEDFIFNLY